jgi:hypothetical protein
MTSSSRRKLRTTAWNAATRIEWSGPTAVARVLALGPSPGFALGLALVLAFGLVLSAVAPSVARADDQPAESSVTGSSASVPPAGVILAEAPEETSVEPEENSADAVADAPEPDDSIVLVALADTTTTAAQKTDTPKEKDAAKNACAEQSKDCKEALKNLRDDGIASIALDIRVGGRPGSDYPCECRLEGETFQPRRFATTTMTWKAAGNCHKPLYFEDWNLERYGHSHGPLDPVFSAAHFFVTLPVLPYKMGVELPWECVYPLGYYRPGNCAPWTVPAVPISCRGFAVEAATVTGLVFLLP